MGRALSGKVGNVTQLELFSEEWAEPTVEEDMAYILVWAAEHGYPQLEYPLPVDLPPQFRDWKTAIFPAGESEWRRVCANIYSSEWLHSAVKFVKKLDR